MVLLKVTILVCDRCSREMREDQMKTGKLDLALKFDDPETSSFLPLRRRETIELCPDCRDAFADWLGDRADVIPGLRPEADGAGASRTVRAQVPGDDVNGQA